MSVEDTLQKVLVFRYAVEVHLYLVEVAMVVAVHHVDAVGVVYTEVG